MNISPTIEFIYGLVEMAYDDQWITVNSSGKEGAGSPVLLGEGGEIKGGMGGKFTGKTMGEAVKASKKGTGAKAKGGVSKASIVTPNSKNGLDSQGFRGNYKGTNYDDVVEEAGKFYFQDGGMEKTGMDWGTYIDEVEKRWKEDEFDIDVGSKSLEEMSLKDLEQYKKELIGKYDKIKDGGIAKKFRDEEALVSEKIGAIKKDSERKHMIGDFSDTIDEKESEAISNYMVNGYKPVNSFLREGKASGGGKKSEISSVIKGLDSAFAGIDGIKEEMNVYRGMKATRLSGLKEGDVFEDKGFVSTTTNKDVASGFSKKGTGDTSAVLNIKIPKGGKALSLVGDNYEQEILINRDSKFKVLRVNKPDKNGVVVYDLEVVQ